MSWKPIAAAFSAGVSIDTLAEAFGVEREQIRRWWNGRDRVADDQREAIVARIQELTDEARRKRIARAKTVCRNCRRIMESYDFEWSPGDAEPHHPDCARKA